MHGFTPQQILDDIQVFNDTNISRDNLVNKKDISNIKNQYNIEGIQRHHNEIISVSSWVEEMEALEYNYIVQLLFSNRKETKQMSYAAT